MKTPELPFENPSAPDSLYSSQQLRFTPRQTRVLVALADAVGWVSREEVDRIAGASNGPQIIMELRRKVAGHDGIEMQRTEVQDRDGKSCKPGRYRLTPSGRERVQKALSLLVEAV